MRLLIGLRALGGHPAGDAEGTIDSMRSSFPSGVAEIRESRDGELDCSWPDAILFIGNLNWFPRSLRELRARRGRPLTAVWHYEPLPPSRASGLPRPRLHLREIAKVVMRDIRTTDVYSNAWRLARCHREGSIDRIAVTTRGRLEYLREQGIPCEWVPLGSKPSYGRDLGLGRDIDVLFLGTMDVPRRRRIVEQLRSRGANVQVAGDWHDPAYWGEDRTRLLNRTKILLNLGRTAGELSGLRFMLGMTNKAMVLSEPVYMPDPYVPGQHFVMAPIDELPATAAHYLRDEAARTRIAEAGHALVTTELSIERSTGRILALLERRAA